MIMKIGTTQISALTVFVLVIGCINYVEGTNFTAIGTEYILPDNYVEGRAGYVDLRQDPPTIYFTAYSYTMFRSAIFKFESGSNFTQSYTKLDLPATFSNPTAMIVDESTDLSYIIPDVGAKVVKVNLTSYEVVEMIQLTSLSGSFVDALYDKKTLKLYLAQAGSISSNATVSICDVQVFNGSHCDTFELESKYKEMSKGVLDSDSGFAYFGYGTFPGEVVKMNVSSGVSIGPVKSINLIHLYDFLDQPSSVYFDSEHKKGYFGATGYVAKVDLNPVNTFQVEAIARLEANELPKSMGIDTYGGVLIIGTTDGTTATRVIQLDLNSLEKREEVVSLDNKVPSSVLVTPQNRTAYVLTRMTPAEIFKISLVEPCSVDCGDNGECDFGLCSCTGAYNGKDWTGTLCNELACPTKVVGSICSGNGVCQNGTCSCTANYDGTECNNQTCPNGCSGQGTCNLATLLCKCKEGWQGTDCSDQLHVVICDELKTCAACYETSKCGWCSSTNMCMDGGIEGPADLATPCSNWAYDSCPDFGIFAASIIALFFTVLLVFINFVSAIQEDKALHKTIVRGSKQSAQQNSKVIQKSWWRSQRSAKAWALVDRIQFLSMLVLVGGYAPSVLVGFTNPLKWSIFGVETPEKVADIIGKGTQIVASMRRLLSPIQYARSVGVETGVFVLIGILFWFLAVLFLIGIIMLIVWYIGKKKNWDDGFEKAPATVPTRYPYVLLRYLLFSYNGLVVGAALVLGSILKETRESGWTVQSATENSVWLSLSAIILIITGLIMPLWTFLKLKNKGKRLFNRKFRVKYGCLYEPFYFKKSHFLANKLAHKFFVALIMGISAVEPLVGIGGVAVVQLMHAFVVYKTKPYLDKAHMIMEIVGCVIDGLVMGATFFFRDPVTELNTFTRNITSQAILVSQLVMVFYALSLYINSWLYMWGVYSISQLGTKVFDPLLRYRKERLRAKRTKMMREPMNMMGADHED